jgi:hypothetical protein
MSAAQKSIGMMNQCLHSGSKTMHRAAVATQKNIPMSVESHLDGALT